MTSSPTTRNRLLKQGTGDNTNTWGDQQSSGDFDMIDIALDGMLQLTVTAPVTLSTANYVSDQARNRSIKILAASSLASTVTLPAVEKWYLVWNASSYDQIIASQGGGASVTVKAGEMVSLVSDAVNVARLTPITFTAPAAGFSFSGGPVSFGTQRLTSVATPTATTDATNKTYVDTAISSAAFSMGSFGVPITGADSGKFLTNNGTTPSWGDVVLPTRTVTGGGLVTGGGALSANLTLTVTAAAASDVRAGSDTSKALTSAALMASSAFQTLTDASTIAWNAASGYNATVTLAASGHTIGAPTNLYDGLSVSLEIVQDATGSRTVNWASIWDFGAAGLPVLQTAANKADRVFGQYNARTSKIEASYRKGA